jgi:hypothetical protein
MEQTTQQISQKPPLPIETKIAAWWLIIIGGIGLIFSVWNILSLLVIFFGESWGQESGWALIGTLSFGVIVLLSIFFLLPGIFLLRKKRWAWWVSIIIYSGISLYLFSVFLSPRFSLTPLNAIDFCYLLLFFIPFILLLLDRKNFFKVAS